MTEIARPIAEEPWDHRRELQRLFQLEYGEPLEFLFRIAGTLIGGIIVWAYAGWTSPLYWIAIYFIIEFGYIFFLRSAMLRATAIDVKIAHGLFVLSLISFVWLPIKMIASTDDALSVSGFCILGGLLVFLVRRSERSFKLTLMEVAVISIAFFIGIGVILLRQTNLFAQLGLVFAVAALAFYLLQSATIVRQQRMQAEEAIKRTIQAQKMEAIGQLAGGVAHDFNNILQAVIWNLDLIEDTTDPALRKELIDDARKSTMHGARVVSQLLVYARETALDQQHIQVNTLLREVESMCQALIPATTNLELALAEDDITIFVDQPLFITAMLNLVKNAVDANIGAGLVRITASGQRFDEPMPCQNGVILERGEYVCVRVSDSGSGIPASNVHRVMDPFFTTKPVGKGTGMGLSMVAGFTVRSSGGIIIDTSESGTSIEMILPQSETHLSAV